MNAIPSSSLCLICFLAVSVVAGSSASVPYGRIAQDEFVLTQQQIDTFFRDGLVTIPNVLTEEEVVDLEHAFERFMNGTISVPGKDFCDMSKPFGTPRENWSIINAMLPTKYDTSLQNNVYERITQSMVNQLFPDIAMVKDYDQLLNKLPGRTDAVFSWHQDMAYWPGPQALGVTGTETATFSLAIDDSTPENGCLRFVVGSGTAKRLRKHKPLVGNSRDEGHALTAAIEPTDVVQLAPAKRGSLTIHDEWVVHGSGGNTLKDQHRRTYVLAYRSQEIVQAERNIGFTHSHNDVVNWDTFHDGEAHRVKAGRDAEL
jgi:ectoine hydroxylase-related dioxygenase (phytanoyl-CoA dioxygenase family)